MKVMAKDGYTAVPEVSYKGDVIGMIWSVLLIFGGLSGAWVLRGTDSSEALVYVGLALLAWDIISVVLKKKRAEKAEEQSYAFYSRLRDEETVASRDERALPERVSVRIVCDKQLKATDFGARINGDLMTYDVKTGEYTGLTGRVHNIVNFSYLDLTAVFDVEPDAHEIVFNLCRDNSGIGLELPENVCLIEG